MSLVVHQQIALASKTTLKTGGAAQFYVEVNNVAELQQAVAFASAQGLPVFVLGGGSNTLVPDSGYAGLVIKIGLLGQSYTQLSPETWSLTVAAGEVFDEVVAAVAKRGLWGLENLAHIPGSVGATPVQNVGAYGVEVADVIATVSIFDTGSKKLITLTKADCHFAYRHSIFKEQKQLIITAVTFLLSVKANPKLAYADLAQLALETPTPQTIRQAVIKIRAGKFPDWKVVGTAGSFFKNPIITWAQAQALLEQYPSLPTYPAGGDLVKVSLGYILDKICGLKGFAIGPVSLYEKQALVLVAATGATTTDILNFKKIVSEKVFEKTFLHIEPEVTEI